MPKRIDVTLTDILVEKKMLTRDAADGLLAQSESSGIPLGQLLIQQGTWKERDIMLALSERLRMSCVDLKDISVDRGVLERVPVKIASYYKFVPLSITGSLLSIAVAAPLEIKTQDEIRTQLGLDLTMSLACMSDISDALARVYGLAADTLDRIQAQSAQSAAPVETRQEEKVEDIEKLAGDASVIKVVNQIIVEAFKKRATDIHIEPFRQGVALRYRVDGILYDAHVPPDLKLYVNAIISRIKIMSSLNIVERRLPQDGRAVVRVQEQVLDLRVSTIPTPHGESVVIRILPTTMLFSLEKLGLSKDELQIFERLIQKPHGIIFVTGPTGSGKTTTLYACLSRINTKDRKIITIEDPIEYEMPGITQIQVLPEIGLDFARGLRSILRHDPDVIMVGEVRDFETAETAIRVALTGHLVFSTLHTNDAASGINRLIDIGVEPYMLASSVEAFIAQRLIRVICPECKYEDTNASAELKRIIAQDMSLPNPEVIKVYRGKGCAHCNFTGFFGRTAIYEILLLDDVLKDFILKKGTASQLKRIAISRGMRTLLQDGWDKVLQGVTVPEEVMKVTVAEETAHRQEESTDQLSSLLDKRAYPRLSYKASLIYSLVHPSSGKEEEPEPDQVSVSKDISAGGLCLVVTEQLKPGALLDLRITLPDDATPISCLAKVMRVQRTAQENIFEAGVCFMDMNGADRMRLEKYVAYHL